MNLDTTNWSGEGAFTQVIVEALRGLGNITDVKVEDAPATRSEADYNFISNEVFVVFERRHRKERKLRFGMLPTSRVIEEPVMTMAELEAQLSGVETVGPPDYSDEGMLQYLRTERVIPPYQTRGYKLVELVRIYEAGTPRRD